MLSSAGCKAHTLHATALARTSAYSRSARTVRKDVLLQGSGLPLTLPLLSLLAAVVLPERNSHAATAYLWHAVFFQALLFIEELMSVFLAPYLLAVSLPRCAGVHSLTVVVQMNAWKWRCLCVIVLGRTTLTDHVLCAESICCFIRDNSIHVPGLGDVCSLAQFDFERHGSRRYGGPDNVRRDHRSRQVGVPAWPLLLRIFATYPASICFTQPNYVEWCSQELILPLPDKREPVLKLPSCSCACSGQDGEVFFVVRHYVQVLGAASSSAARHAGVSLHACRTVSSRGASISTRYDL